MSKEEKKPPPPKKKNPRTPYALLQMELQKADKSNNKKDTSTPIRKVSFTNSASKNNSSDKNNNSDKMKHSKDSKPSTSKDYEEPEDPDVPNRTYGDLYCPICDSHMNSEAMWEAHISGKRHLKNVKKGDTDSRYDVLEVESTLVPALKNVKEPIVGLSYVQETRRREPNVPPCYNCFLCHSSLSTPALVIEHLITKKHRLNYIREHEPSEYELIAAINLKKGIIDPLVHEAARKLEEKFSRGTVIVKLERPKRVVPLSGKRNFDYDDDYDDDYRKPKFSRNDSKEPYVWKSVDTVRKLSSREFETQHKRSYHPDERSYLPDERSYHPDDRSYHPDESDFKRRRDSPESRYLRDYSPKPDYMQERDYPRGDYSREKKYRERDYSPERVKYEKSSSLDKKYPRAYEPPPSNEDSYIKPRKSYSKSSDLPAASEQYHPLPSSFQPPATVLPHEKPSVTAPTEPFQLKDFVQKVFALPAEAFLKIALHKLENMDIKEIDELSLLCKLMNKIRELICSKLPPDMQNLIKQKFSDNVAQPASAPAPALPPQTPQSSAENVYKPAIPQEKPPDFSLIRDILNSANISTNLGPSHPSPSQQNASLLSNFQNNIASLLTNKKESPFHGQNSNSFSAPSQVEARAMYQNQISPTQIDRSVASPSYVNSADSPSAYYNSSQTPPKPSVSIPGLTLAENDQAESQLYNNYKSNYPSENIDRRHNYPTNSDKMLNSISANSDRRQNYPPTADRQNYPPTPDRQNYPPAADRQNYPPTADRQNYPPTPDRQNYPSATDRQNYPFRY